MVVFFHSLASLPTLSPPKTPSCFNKQVRHNFLVFFHHVMCNCDLIPCCAISFPHRRQKREFEVCRLSPVALCVTSHCSFSLLSHYSLHYLKLILWQKMLKIVLYCGCIFDEQLWLPLTSVTNLLSFIWLLQKKSHPCVSTVKHAHCNQEQYEMLGFISTRN